MVASPRLSVRVIRTPGHGNRIIVQHKPAISVPVFNTQKNSVVFMGVCFNVDTKLPGPDGMLKRKHNANP